MHEILSFIITLHLIFFYLGHQTLWLGPMKMFWRHTISRYHHFTKFLHQNDQSYLANETFCGNERLFVCCCNCVGSALGFPEGRRGEGRGSNNFTLIYRSTPYQHNSTLNTQHPIISAQL